MHFVNELHRCANCEPFCARSLSPIPGSSRWLFGPTHPSIPCRKVRGKRHDGFVCRGTGTRGPLMRLWRRGEIVRITLQIQQDG